eukprot:145793_1
MVSLSENENTLEQPDLNMLEEDFKAAAEQVWKYRYSKAFQNRKMHLYGLYKVATIGECQAKKPSKLLGNEVSRDKWKHWRMTSTFSKEEAMALYITSSKEVVEESLGGNQGDEALDEICRLNERNKKLEEYLKHIEEEVEVIHLKGNDISGWLYRWNDIEWNFMFGLGQSAVKWEKIFVLLRDTKLYLYKSEAEPSPDGTFSLTGCILRDEGIKLGPINRETGERTKYHIFGLYLAGGDTRGPNSGVLLRMSSNTEDVARKWIIALGKASAFTEDDDEPAPILGLPRPLSLAKSIMSLEQKEPEKKEFTPWSYPASKPMHTRVQVSILSRDTPGEKPNFEGFMNLGIIIFIVNNSSRLFISFKENGPLGIFGGVRMGPMHSLEDWPCLTGVLLFPFHVICAYWVEALCKPPHPKISQPVVTLLHVINISACVIIPLYRVWTHSVEQLSPTHGFLYIYGAILLWMKLVSYAHANRDMRLAWNEAATGPCANDKLLSPIKDDRGRYETAYVKSTTTNLYPSNITFTNIVFFWVAPTCSYQLEYPRTDKIRWYRLLLLFLYLLLALCTMALIWDQNFLPAVKSSYHPLVEGHYIETVQVLLSLSIPSTYIWLVGFYAYFHLVLNMSAEITYFGDRVFYKDWWNAKCLEEYWTLWNIPVHVWVARHVYYPCQRKGISKDVSRLLCFLLSAAFHEALISVPFRTLRFYSFLAMCANVPLGIFTRNLMSCLGKESQAGNIVFWV